MSLKTLSPLDASRLTNPNALYKGERIMELYGLHSGKFTDAVIREMRPWNLGWGSDRWLSGRIRSATPFSGKRDTYSLMKDVPA